MKINTNYLDRFIKSKVGYLYPIRKGFYLCFDSDTLEYKYIIEYVASYKVIDNEACKVLEELYSKSILL